MFKELAPYLRQRAVLLTVTHLDEDQIRVNVIPQKLKDGENAALTTPLSVTGSAEELDRELPPTLVNFVSSHLQLKNTLDKAQKEIDEAAKAAQANARAKTKAPAKKDATKPETERVSATPRPIEPARSDPPKTGSLFGTATSDTERSLSESRDDEEEEILAEISDEDELDEAA